MLQVHHLTFNPFQENTYILYDETKSCVIIDPGCYDEKEQTELVQFIERYGLTPVRLLNTHCHIDHVLGNKFVSERYGLTAEAHPLEAPVLAAVGSYGSMFGFHIETPPTPQYTLAEGTSITFGATQLDVYHTPGHSPGSVCFHDAASKQLIGGDVLFRLSIGRTDLPGGDMETLIDSIRNTLFLLPADTYVYPGHGPGTTLDFERMHNPFLHAYS